MRHQLIFLVVLLAVAMTANAKNSSCTAINNVPTVINSAGSYCLTADLVVNTALGSNAAITIAADNVDLDLDGHSLSGVGGATSGYGVYALMHVGLHVHGGMVKGFNRAVFLEDTWVVGVVGQPPVPSGASSRHEVDHLQVIGAGYGIYVTGAFSSVHDNRVRDSSQIGIRTETSFLEGVAGAVDVLRNEVLNTVASNDVNAIGISAGGVGSVVQDNIVSGLRGHVAESGSAGILATGGMMILSRNRETDLGGNTPVYCYTASPANKVEGNLQQNTTNDPVFGIHNCLVPTSFNYNSNY